MAPVPSLLRAAGVGGVPSEVPAPRAAPSCPSCPGPGLSSALRARSPWLAPGRHLCSAGFSAAAYLPAHANAPLPRDGGASLCCLAPPGSDGRGEAETRGRQVMWDLSGSKGPPRGALETRPAECPGCTGGGRRPRGWGRGHVLVEEPGSVTGGLWGRGEDPGQPRGGELRYSVGMWPWGQVTGEDSPWPACLRVRSSGPRSRDLAEKVAMGTQRWPLRAWGACLLDSQSQEVTVRAPAQASCRLLQSGVLSAP